MNGYLSKYPTTLDYDIKYFEKNKNKMEFNEYNCYVIRIGEKKILNYYLNMAIDILSSIEIPGLDKLLETAPGKATAVAGVNQTLDLKGASRFLAAAVMCCAGAISTSAIPLPKRDRKLLNAWRALPPSSSSMRPTT